MKMVVLYPQIMLYAALGADLGLAVYKPYFSYVLATAFDLDAYVVVVPGIYPVVGLRGILAQRPSPPFEYVRGSLFYYIT
jgi:hypothetical protein